MGRSLPSTSDGRIREETVNVNGQDWKAYAVGGSPAQAVLHGILEISAQKPDLIVSGINYGENVGTGITVSGTVGAAMEAAALGFPALAVSLQADTKYHLSHSEELDFSVAAHFTALFAKMLLEKSFPDDVHVLKVEVPTHAKIDTPWEVTRIARQRYYDPVKPERTSWDDPVSVGYKEAADLENESHNTDVYALRKKQIISVTPISLDMTSRVDLTELEKMMRSK
jgi:5'-nucleotidase